MEANVQPVRDRHGFLIRGEAMTRIEVFVDAAFAFAVTLLVISFDAIPQTYDEIIVAIKSIPAFVVAVAQLVWIWYEHSRWSQRFGLDDALTTVLSASLLIVVLIYIYPLRIMIAGMFAWFTDGYLPSNFQMDNFQELANMFVFMGIGFSALCLVFFLFYQHAYRRRALLDLSPHERFHTRTICLVWLVDFMIGLAAIGTALLLPDQWVPFSGFVYVLLAVTTPLIYAVRHRQSLQDDA